MKHKKNYVIKPHLHLKRVNKIFYTSETIILLKGKLRIDFYDNRRKYLFSKILYSSDPREISFLCFKRGHQNCG